MIVEMTEGKHNALNRMKFSVCILAGGKSSRMGTDKSQLFFRGEMLVDHLIKIVSPYSDDILISGTSNKRAAHHTVIADLQIEKGPLAGIFTGLTNAKNDWVLILACDMPLFSKELMNWLVKQVDSIEHQKIAFVRSDKEHYLIGFYHRSLLPEVTQLFTSNDLSVRQLVQGTDYLIWDLPADLQNAVTNINSPKDLGNFGWMKVKILAFGQIQEVIGHSEMEWITEGKTLSDLKMELLDQFPILNRLTFRMAVNESITDEQVLSMNDIVALLPPFAGG